jgi:uncharacterized protein YpiB (UPF0302 family)
LRHKYGAKLHQFSERCTLIDLLLGSSLEAAERERLLKEWDAAFHTDMHALFYK